MRFRRDQYTVIATTGESRRPAIWTHNADAFAEHLARRARARKARRKAAKAARRRNR